MVEKQFLIDHDSVNGFHEDSQYSSEPVPQQHDLTTDTSVLKLGREIFQFNHKKLYFLCIHIYIYIMIQVEVKEKKAGHECIEERVTY